MRCWHLIGAFALSWFCPKGSAGEDRLPELQWPTIEPARVARGFGVPTLEAPGRRHVGLDVVAPAASPVYAAERGTVRWVTNTYIGADEAGRHPGARNAVVIEHEANGQRFLTSYGHINPGVKVGQTVERGAEIGTIADWGRNTHLHFGLKRGAFDPKNPGLALRGRALPDELAGFEDPAKSMRQRLIEDVSRNIADVFDGAPPTRRVAPVEVGAAAREEARRIIPDVSRNLARLFGDPREPRVLQQVDLSAVPTKVYRDPGSRFALRIPETWTVQEEQRRLPRARGAPQEEDISVIFWGPANGRLSIGGTRGIPRTGRGAPASVLEAARQYTRFFGGTGTQLEEPVAVTIGNNIPAARTGWRHHDPSGFEISTTTFFVAIGEYYVPISTYSPARNQDELVGFLIALGTFGYGEPSPLPARGQSDAVADASPDAFATARNFTRKWEGGYVNDPDDPGGATNFGVTQSTYDRFRQRWGHAPRPVRDIAPEEVDQIYRSYWESSGAGSLSYPLSVVHFDSSFHFKPRRAETWKNEVLAAHGDDPRAAAKAYVEKRIAFRHERVRQEPSQRKFLQGWLNRDDALLKLVTGGAE